MTARALLKFIDEIRDDETLDYLKNDLCNQLMDICVEMECCLDKKKLQKLRQAYKNMQEKMDAIEVIKYQRLLLFKLAMQQGHGMR